MRFVISARVTGYGTWSREDAKEPIRYGDGRLAEYLTINDPDYAERIAIDSHMSERPDPGTEVRLGLELIARPATVRYGQVIYQPKLRCLGIQVSDASTAS